MDELNRKQLLTVSGHYSQLSPLTEYNAGIQEHQIPLKKQNKLFLGDKSTYILVI